jgi:two-component system, sensor histidine kinase
MMNSSDPEPDQDHQRGRDVRHALPKLLQRCESSRALTMMATERARRAADHARALHSKLLLNSENRPAVDAWDAAARAIARAARERDRALGTLSHELRQGLNAALSAEQLLALTTDADVAGRARTVLHRQLLHMSRLVDDLLDFSRLSLDGGSISRRACDVREIVTQALAGIDAGIAERHLRLSVTQPDEPVIVFGDPTRLQQVVSNLLHNAVRYTPAGGAIAVRVVETAGWVTIDVKDSGEGIDATHIAAIFQPFVRRSDDGPGLGIGLTLAQRFVELHGGTIAAQSDGHGRGSVFSVRLPLTPPA